MGITQTSPLPDLSSTQDLEERPWGWTTGMSSDRDRLFRCRQCPLTLDRHTSTTSDGGGGCSSSLLGYILKHHPILTIPASCYRHLHNSCFTQPASADTYLTQNISRRTSSCNISLPGPGIFKHMKPSVSSCN